MPEIFDSHAHYDDEAFDPDREALLAAFPAAGVCGVINAASDITSAWRSLALAEQFPHVWAAVGIHPEAAHGFDEGSLPTLRLLAAHPRAVAIGEIGLDYHWDTNPPRAQQQACFEAQLALAAELDLPVIVHDRDAHEDTLTLLRRYRPKGVLHCFSGHVEMMREVVDLGMYIGLGGAVTFKGAKKPVAVAAAVPADRLLLETDAPYMAPVPHRGERCDSRLIPHVAEVIAAVRGTTAEELLALTAQNARCLFGL